jgi:hypothetical protein
MEYNWQQLLQKLQASALTSQKFLSWGVVSGFNDTMKMDY